MFKVREDHVRSGQLRSLKPILWIDSTMTSYCSYVMNSPIFTSSMKIFVFFSAECQKADWKAHKRSMCAMPAILHQVDKSMRMFNGHMRLVNHLEKLAWEQRRRNPVPASACDGCWRRFRGVPVKEGSEDEDRGDAGDRFKRCTECDYTICKDCTHPEKQG